MKKTIQKIQDVDTYFSMHNHSMYSFRDGYATPKEYLDKAHELNLKGFAITEHGNQCSWVYFDKIKKDYPNIKMVYGNEFYEYDNNNSQNMLNQHLKEAVENKYYHLLVLAKDEEGRKIINRLQRLSNENFYFKPRVNLSMFEKEDCSHLIVSSACLASRLARHKENEEICIEYIKEYKKVFPNFYLEVQSHSTIQQQEYNKFIIYLSEITNTPFVITTDSHYANKEDSVYHAWHVKNSKDKEAISEIYDGCHLQSPREIHECLDSQIGHDNVEKGLRETLTILDSIEDVCMPWQEPQLPLFEIPKDFENDFEYLKYLTKDVGWKNRRLDTFPIEKQKIYMERLDYELSVINKMGFNGYFLIVWDFINWAKNNGVEVGAGRGSACSSCCNWLLGISDPDPIKYKLVFERFLNVERVSMPDIDCDFSDREKIVEYLTVKYGYDKVAQVCNFNYITPLVAIKTACKVTNVSFSIATQLSSHFTKKTWKECIESETDFIEKNNKYYEVFEIASKLSGRINSLGTHAGGLVIARTTLDDYIGTLKTAKEGIAVNVDKKMCESIGLVKFDLLGVATLRMVQEAKRDANMENFEIDINNEKFIHDTKTYELIAKANTNAVFQLESAGMKDLCTRLKPSSVEEVSDIIALYRPDAMMSLEDYIKNKTDTEHIEYWCKEAKDILSDTYGALVYQEEMMDIVRIIGGRTYGGADRFRKGVGKKDLSLVMAEAISLKNEIIQNGFSEELAQTISDYLMKFGNYLFCKSHSIGYTVLVMQTAYIKAHFPLHFFKALLNLNKDDYGNLNKYISDAQDCGVEVMKPNINKSQREFSVVDGKILFGLEGIKDNGTSNVDLILEEREKGNFKNMKDLLERVPMHKKSVVSLIKSGAIPSNNKKDMLMAYGKSLFKKSEFRPIKSFSMTLSMAYELTGIDFEPLSKEERICLLNNFKKQNFEIKQEEQEKKHLEEFQAKYMTNDEYWEYETLSIFLTNNPFKESEPYLKKINAGIDIGKMAIPNKKETSDDEEIENEENNIKYEPLEYLKEETETPTKCIVVGVVTKITKKKDRHGKDYAFINLYSESGLLEITVWSNQYSEFKDFIKKGNSLAIVCNKQDNDQLVAKAVQSYDKWIEYVKNKHNM